MKGGTRAKVRRGRGRERHRGGNCTVNVDSILKYAENRESEKELNIIYWPVDRILESVKKKKKSARGGTFEGRELALVLRGWNGLGVR